MKNSRRIFAFIGILICVVALLCVSLLRYQQTPETVQSSAADGPTQNAHAPTHPASSLWHLTPSETITPVQPSGDNRDPHNHSATVVVAELDTRAAAASLPTVKAGDDIELALPNGEITRAHVNLVQNNNGVLRLGGSLPEKQGGSFALALDNQSQLTGMILLRDVELAYTLQPAAQPGISRMEASALSDVICHPLPRPPGENDGPQAIQSDIEGPLATIPALSSRPTATAVLYLCFDGATVTDPLWNDGNTIVAAASTLTADAITQVWKRVSEDYSPFDIDVTTEKTRYENAPAGRRMRCIITPTKAWYPNAGGVAYVNSFSHAGTYYMSADIPCWVFNAQADTIAEAISHELGHTLGLRHDGRTTPQEEYFHGHGTPPMSWGPIMGASYYLDVVQWSKGEYAHANNSEDDIAIIANTAINGFGFMPATAGVTRQTATPITIASGTFSGSGVIRTQDDANYYSLTLAAPQHVSLNAMPARLVASPQYTSQRSANLDINMELLDSAGGVITSSNPALSMFATIDRNLDAGTYYIKLEGGGYGDPPVNGFNKYGSIGQYAIEGSVTSTVAPPVITGHPQSKSVYKGDYNFHLAVTATGVGPLRYQWQKDDVDLVESPYVVSGVTSGTLYIYHPEYAASGTYAVRVSNIGGEVTSNAAIITVIAPPAPVITAQPQSKAVSALDSRFTLSVTATGIGAFSYQWQKSGTDIAASSHYAGINDRTLTVYGPDAFDAGDYTVKVGNEGGTTTSEPATISVTLPAPPVITDHPGSISRVAGSGSPLSLAVTATGAGTLTYQWQKGGADLPVSTRYSGTIRTLTISDYVVADTGEYRVRVSNKGGSVYSNGATVSIALPDLPQITTQPSDCSVVAGDYSASLSVYATGIGLKYQWQKNGENISGATSNFYSITNPKLEDDANYRVIISNPAGSVTSNTAHLTVTLPPLPVITSQTGNTSVVEGESFNLSCSVNSVWNTSYQWYKDNQPITSATYNSYSVSSATLAQAGVYKVAVTNPAGTVYGAGITVSVAAATAPVFTRHPASQSTYEGRLVTFTAAATGRPAPTYQWKKNGAVISYSTSNTHAISSPQESDAAVYTVVATNSAGSVTSEEATLTVLSKTSGNTLGIFPAEKMVGCARVTYRIWVRGNARWTVTKDAPWISVSRTKGASEDVVEITVAPNPIPVERETIITIGGYEHTLVQHAAGTPVRELWGAGSNGNGQLGNYMPADPYYPKSIPMAATTLASGGSHTLFVDEDGTLWASGKNEYGQLGDGTTEARQSPVRIATGVRAVAAGEKHSLFIKTDNSLWTMGCNDNGQLGIGAINYSPMPIPVHMADNVASVTAGASHSLFIKTDGTLWAMGHNYHGQLGNGSNTDRPAPTQVATAVKAVVAGANHTLLIKTDGSLLGMGLNSSGQLGTGDTSSASLPINIASDVQNVAAGSRHSLFVTNSGALMGMGYSYNGELGPDSYTYAQTTPIQITTSVKTVAAGASHNLFIKTDDTLWAMGYNNNGQLGDGTTSNRLSSVHVAANVSRAYAGGSCSFYIDADGNLMAMGDDSSGALGVGFSNTRNSVPIHIASDIQTVSAGNTHTLLVTTGSSLLTFGNNDNGQLGDGSTTARHAPLEMATGVRDAFAGSAHSLFIKTDGSLNATGYNSNGQLGTQGPLPSYRTPSLVAQYIKHASAGESHSLYIDDTGALWAVGNNGHSQLGISNDDVSESRVPLQVATNAQSASAGTAHSLVLKNDATLWSAGNNVYGQLGRDYGTPEILTQVATGVTKTAAGYFHSLWLKTDGSLYATGNNEYGQLGTGTSGYGANHTPVITATNARAIAAGYCHSLYIDNENILRAAGYNGNGQLGDGTTANQAAYKKVAANVDSVSAGQYHTLFIATGDIRLDPPPPPAITNFTPTNIVAQSAVTITGSNFTEVAGVYFGNLSAQRFTVDSPTQITAYAPVIPLESGRHIHVGTFNGAATSPSTYTSTYAPMLGDPIPDQTVRLGNNISIHASVLGAPEPAIIWQVSANGVTWSNVINDLTHGGAGTHTLTITNAPPSLNGNRYRFIATNVNGAATGNTFTLTVAYPPEILTHPSPQTATAGAGATFTAGIGGAPTPALQWQISTDGGLTWADIAGATGSTHTIATVTAAMNGHRHRLVATNECGAATTNAATLTVQWPPAQNNPITSQVGVLGGTITFSVGIDANPVPTSYQWQVSTNGGTTWTNLANDASISGADAASLTLSGATASMNGNLYRCVVSNGVGPALTTSAASLTVIDSMFATPSGLFIASGTLYVSDADTHTIHKVTLSTGKATLFAGAIGQSGTTNSTTGANARFNAPAGLVLTQADNLVYVLDSGNVIRRITATGGVTTLLTHDFGNASGITITPADTLFIAEGQNHVISRIHKTGSTLRFSAVSGATGMPGSGDYLGPYTRYREPAALAKIPGQSRLVIADTGNHTIRITYYDAETGGANNFYTYTLAGLAGQAGSLDGTGTTARFNRPEGLAASTQYYYIADTGNHTIRRADEFGAITTLAGLAGQTGYSDGTGTNARFNKPTALALDSTHQNLYIADSNNSVIRKLNLATNEVTTMMISATGTAVSPPVITAHPQNITATAGLGSPLTLTFTATGAGPFTTMWQKDGENITPTSRLVIGPNSLSIHNHATTDSGQYRVIVTNAAGSVASNAATVTVTASTGPNTNPGGGSGGGGAPSLWLLGAALGLAATRLRKK